MFQITQWQVSVLKKNYSIFILIFVSFFVIGCANTPAERGAHQKLFIKGEFSKGILWKIEKMDSPASYVFGTMHSEDERVVNLPQEINTVFSAASIFAMEMILDEENTQQILQGMYFQDGRTLKSITTKKTYLQSIEAMAKRGMPEKTVNLMKPWAVFTVLNMPEQNTGLFLDVLLYLAASKDGKVLVGLETTQEQLAVFDGMSMETQLSLLEITLDSADDLHKMLDETLEIYLTRDLDKILDLNERYLAVLDKDIADEFNQRLLVERNRRMVKRMMPLLEKGNAFIAIGALHLPGITGVLTILNNAGYTVTAEY